MAARTDSLIVSRRPTKRRSGAAARDPIRFFLAGPTWVPPEALEEMLRPMVAHRSAAFKEVYASLTGRLGEIFRTGGDVMLATGSATLVMEIAVVSTVERRVLNLVGGAFAERWHKISLAAGKTADRIEIPWGRAIDPDLLRRAMRRRRYDAVTVVHNETSTGVINPLEEISRVVREESDALILVDAVSSLGGARVESDRWGLDLVLTGSQKALAAPPGLVPFAVSRRAARRAERVEGRGFYTDLLRYLAKHREGGTITTPAISVAYALDRRLADVLDEGMEERWARHRENRDRTVAWAVGAGFEPAAEEGARSPTLTCLKVPKALEARITAPELVRALAARGFTVAGGYGEWKRATFRIGHMGEISVADLDPLFSTIDRVVSDPPPRAS